VVRRVAVEDVVWSFPGSMTISGIARGVDGVIARLDPYLSDIPMAEAFFS
jgi:hypothetical protein